jgi:hypothetical protein
MSWAVWHKQVIFRSQHQDPISRPTKHLSSKSPGLYVTTLFLKTSVRVETICLSSLNYVIPRAPADSYLFQKTQQGSREVGMAICLLQCQQDPCPSPMDELGNILFNGQYKPEEHENPAVQDQNFTVTVPAYDSQYGARAQLATARFHLFAVSRRF